MKRYDEALISLCIIALVCILICLVTVPCGAQWWPISPFWVRFPAYITPYLPFPFTSPVPMVVPPVLAPYTAGVPTISRFADATIIIITQPVNPVTAYAPLGVITLTPSVLIPAALFLTLAE